MLAIQPLVLALFATAHARFIDLEGFQLHPEEYENQPLEYDAHPEHLNRVRRQLGSMSTNPDGSANLKLKVPLARGESNVLSAVGSASGIQPANAFRAAGPGYGAAGSGLALDNINGHGLSLTGQHIPGLGNEVTAAGRLGLINTPDHKLGANAFVTRTMPNIPNFPNFNTHGGSVDYTFKDKIGGSSAMGKLNQFRNPSSSLDLTAGFTKSQSPIPAFNHNWQPQGGLSFTRYF